MNRLIKFAFFFSAVLIFGSCTDLEDTLEDTLVDEFSNDGVDTGGGGGGAGATLAAYNKLRDGTANHGSYFSTQFVSSDEGAITQKGGDWFDGGIWLRMQRHTYLSASGPLNDTWNNAYGGIGQCNTTLGGALTAGEAAEVRVIRAFHYMRLLDLFGRVKIVTESSANPAQSSRSDLYTFVEDELLGVLGIANVTAALDLSGSALSTSTGAYQVNQYSALGLLSKLYLNAEVYSGTAMWQEAEWASQYILDNGPYQLCGVGCSVPNLAKRPAVASDPDELEGYRAIFAPNNEGNPEMIWAVRYDESGAGGMNFAQMTGHYGSQLTWALQDQPWNGYVALEEFYNMYDNNDIRKEHNFLAGLQLDYDGAPVIDYASDDDDLALSFNPVINELEPNAQREGGVRLGKFSFKIFQRPDMDNDYPVLRLGQIHLIHAEAAARAAGDWSLALPEVNVLRQRAGLTTDLTTMTADIFHDERGKEMFMESTRRTDQIRFGKWGDAWWEKAADSNTDLELMPIPQPQIDASEGSLTQNPGY